MTTPIPAYRFNAERRRSVVDQLTRCLTAENAPIAFAYLFGSALDTETVHDVDVGVLFADSLPEAGRLAGELAERLGKAIGLPIDVRVLNHAPISFLYHVFRGRLLLCRDEALLTCLLEDVASRYLDLEPLLRQATKDAFAA
jgi:predicted nucleotidyltransferase